MPRFSRFIFGGIVGAGLALILSPKSGKEMRRVLKGAGWKQLPAPKEESSRPVHAPEQDEAVASIDLEARIDETRRQVEAQLKSMTSASSAAEPAPETPVAEAVEKAAGETLSIREEATMSGTVAEEFVTGPPDAEVSGVEEAPAGESVDAEAAVPEDEWEKGSTEEAAPMAEVGPAAEFERLSEPEPPAPEAETEQPAEVEPEPVAELAPQPEAAPRIDDLAALKTPVEGEPVLEAEPAEVEPEPVAELEPQPETAPSIDDLAALKTPVEGEPVLEAELTVTSEPESATVRSSSDFDRDEMRRRIEETRARLKAKAFDAMVSGETFIEGEEEISKQALPETRFDHDIEFQVDESLTEQD
ncbi:MAG: hypothetical protein IBX61_01945 [Thermoleophilia bacterium]|nr:hypothetical protein [Thermoleophilia bacterium]